MNELELIEHLRNNIEIKLEIKNQGIEATLFWGDIKIDSDRIEGYDLRQISADRMNRPIPPRNYNRRR